MNKVLIVMGPTATGKTDLALKLAKDFNGELVSADSRQIYQGLDIGTGKYPNSNQKIEKGNSFWEIDGIRVWLYDVVGPTKQYSVADYIKDATKIILNIQQKGKLPIIVGGTGFYIKGLLYGFSNLGIAVNLRLREEIKQFSTPKLQNKLQKIYPEKWEKMNNSDRNNPRRLIRAIELANKPFKEIKVDSLASQNNILKFGLMAPREILYERSDKRVISRINQGMIEEAKRLKMKGLSLERMRQLGLEYGILADYLEGKIVSKDQLIKILQFKIHDFIRRQLTWFKKEADVNWFDVSVDNYPGKIEKLVRAWYDSK